MPRVRKKRAKSNLIHAMYKGDEFIAVGTIKEIAEQLGLSAGTIHCYKSEYYSNRAKNKEEKYEVFELEDQTI